MKELLTLALEALEEPKEHFAKHRRLEAITAIKEALAQPEQEPVGKAYLCDRCQTPFDGAYECPSCGHHTSTKEPVYTTPPQRTEQKPVAWYHPEDDRTYFTAYPSQDMIENGYWQPLYEKGAL